MGPEIIGVFIPILLGLGAFAMVFGLRYMRNKENMAMIEKGIDPRYNKKQVSVGYLKWGMLLIGAGVGLFLAFLIDIYMLPYEVEPVAVYFALLAIGGGTGLVISYRVDKKELDKENMRN